MVEEKQISEAVAFKDSNGYAIASLVLMPLVLLVLSTMLSQCQAEQQSKIENARQRLQTTIEADRAQDTILQTYFDDITSILIDERFPPVYRSCLPLGEATTDLPPLVDLARARTQVVINQLEGKRLGSVIGLLAETQLLSAFLNCNLMGVSLAKAKLEHINLEGLMLGQADLQRANLGDVNLRDALLEGADLEGAQLLIARLERANLASANLQNAMLFCAHLEEADLRGADLTGATLLKAYLIDTQFDETTILPDGEAWTAGIDLAQFGVFTAAPTDPNTCPQGTFS